MPGVTLSAMRGHFLTMSCCDHDWQTGSAGVCAGPGPTAEPEQTGCGFCCMAAALPRRVCGERGRAPKPASCGQAPGSRKAGSCSQRMAAARQGEECSKAAVPACHQVVPPTSPLHLHAFTDHPLSHCSPVMAGNLTLLSGAVYDRLVCSSQVQALQAQHARLWPSLCCSVRCDML